jgi:heterotetrameric sarcosine oxidase delta subunit
MGDSTLTRPEMTDGQEAWVDYVYMRTNPAAPYGELWYHDAGCRQIMKIERDTRTHEILS